MTLFTQHTVASAPTGAAEVLAMARERYGFIPNLAAHLAESPHVLATTLALSEAFDNTSLSPTEQQLVLMTVSVLNGCGYCRTAHTGLARLAGMDDATVRAVLALHQLSDPKLNALRDFTRQIVEERGWVRADQVEEFLSAGFTRAQVFEVVLGVALKTLTNFSNHLANAQPNEEFVEMAEGRVAAA